MIARRRRRPLVVVRRRQPLVEGEQPAGLAVLSRQRRRRTDPYHVYGGLQDNSSWVGDSRVSRRHHERRWENMYGGDGFWTFADPTDPDYIYAESQGGYDRPRESQDARDARHPAAAELQRRSCASTGTRRSHCQPERRRARSTSARSSCSARATTARRWERISPDLTTNDPEEAEAGAVGRRHGRQLRRPRCTRRSTRSASRRRTRT